MLRNAVLSLAVLVALPSATQALPPDQIVTYSFREVPSDPLSDVLITMELHLAAQERSGDDVTWKITELHFVETASGDTSSAAASSGVGGGTNSGAGRMPLLRSESSFNRCSANSYSNKNLAA